MDDQTIRALLHRSGISITDEELQALRPLVTQFAGKLAAMLAVDADEEEPAVVLDCTRQATR